MFKDRLNDTLLSLGMSKATLSKKTKIARGTISRYCSGRYVPKFDNVLKIANALNVDPQWLMGYESDPHYSLDDWKRIHAKMESGELFDEDFTIISPLEDALNALIYPTFINRDVEGTYFITSKTFDIKAKKEDIDRLVEDVRSFAQFKIQEILK